MNLEIGSYLWISEMKYKNLRKSNGLLLEVRFTNMVMSLPNLFKNQKILQPMIALPNFSDKC